MKKLIVLSIAIFSVILLSVSPAFSQDVAFNKKSFAQPEIGNSPDNILYKNDVSSKVLRSFRKFFGEKQGVQWSRTIENDFVACYKENSKINYAYFKQDGTIQYTISHYSEEGLPKDVRHTVKSNFYDYSITHVSEVHKTETILYFITVEDKVSIKTIKVNGDEWQVLEDIAKQ